MTDPFRPDIERVRAMLRQCPVFAPTPLNRHGDVLVKDERGRLNLGAFKGLGAIYAMGRYLQRAWAEVHGTNLPDSELLSDRLRDFAADYSFVTASAGNHGLAVATGARLFGARAVIFLPRTAPVGFISRIRATGATVEADFPTYEAAVAAAEAADARGWGILLADIASPGYQDIPRWIMEGYSVIAAEIADACQKHGTWPSHIYLQAGVGGLAAGVAAAVRQHWSHQPEIVIVEPDRAPCLAESAGAGHPVVVQGAPSNMGRLDCKEVSDLAFYALEASKVRYIQISDEQAEQACRQLSDLGMDTSPSGAAGYAGYMADSNAGRKISSALVIITEIAE